VPLRHAEITVSDEGDKQDSLLCGDITIHLKYGEIEYVGLDFVYLMENLISVKIDGKEVVLNQPEKEEDAKRT
tara:strand:+ start:142 stop:360 length:219 start_codon:yes stop_codon:yes gene_type:complete